jgi:hypothetical protein
MFLEGTNSDLESCEKRLKLRKKSKIKTRNTEILRNEFG